MRWSSLMVILFIQLGWSCWESVLNPSWVWNTDEIISINFPWHPKFAQFVCEQYPSVYLYVINFFFPAPPTWYIDACRSRCESPWFDAPQSPSIRHFFAQALYDTLRQRDLVQKVELRAMSEAPKRVRGRGRPDEQWLLSRPCWLNI